jgi:hypothetical protein
MPRGNRGWKKKRLLWTSKRANRGRKGAYGKDKKMMTWQEAMAKVKRNATKIIVPPKDESETAAEAKQAH